MSDTKRDEKSGRFLPGNRSGRPSGLANKVNRTLRECVLMAGEIVGSDGKGKGGLTGYISKIARTDPRAYLALLARLMPVELRSSTVAEPERFRSADEVQRDMEARGLTPERLVELAHGMAERNRSNGNSGLN